MFKAPTTSHIAELSHSGAMRTQHEVNTWRATIFDLLTEQHVISGHRQFAQLLDRCARAERGANTEELYAVLDDTPHNQRALADVIRLGGLKGAIHELGPETGLLLAYLEGKRPTTNEVVAGCSAVRTLCDEYSISAPTYARSRGWEVAEDKLPPALLAKRELALYRLFTNLYAGAGASSKAVGDLVDLSDALNKFRRPDITDDQFYADISKASVQLVFNRHHPFENSHSERERKRLGLPIEETNVSYRGDITIGSARFEARAYLDGPVGLVLSFTEAPISMTSFFPEGPTSCSIIQNQRSYFYCGSDGNQPYFVNFKNQEVPLLRSVDVPTMMIQLGRNFLECNQFSEVRVPAAIDENIGRFRNRAADPGVVRRFYDRPAERCNFLATGARFYTSSPRIHSRHLRTIAGKPLPIG